MARTSHAQPKIHDNEFGKYGALRRWKAKILARLEQERVIDEEAVTMFRQREQWMTRA